MYANHPIQESVQYSALVEPYSHSFAQAGLLKQASTQEAMSPPTPSGNSPRHNQKILPKPDRIFLE
jgi:hypothetical protein